MENNRFYRTTTGMDPLVYVGVGTAYSPGATIADFQASAAEGQVGIYYGPTEATPNALVPTNANPAAGTEVYIAYKRGGRVETSNLFLLNKGVVTKIAYQAAAKHKITLTIVGGVTPVAGDVWSIKITETTPASQPFPLREYDYVVKTGDTVALVLTGLAAAINNTLNPTNQGGDALVTATSTATTLVLESKTFGTHFKVFPTNVAYGKFTQALTTGFKVGAGTPDMIALFEAESEIKKGVTTNYPDGGTIPEDWGKPTSLLSTAGTYVTYQLTPTNIEASPTPVERHYRKNFLYIFIPSGSTAIITALDVVFGLAAPV